MVLRLLIDAVHPDETRVVIADNSRIHDFDFVTAAKSQVKGNIYLAKITRVEPSLQAAFVEYGGGKQGFLPFAEIHPDYYQIPMADRKRLMEEAERDNEDEDDVASPSAAPAPVLSEQSFPEAQETSAPREIFPLEPVPQQAESFPLSETHQEIVAETQDTPVAYSEPQPEQQSEAAPAEAPESQEIETLASDEDAVRESRPASYSRRYKIQEVIKRNQIVLVQVIKEERGNKGVSLTTFISLAGRYCVLMPNSPKGGGISRKIMSGEDRKRLKEISAELQTARGMSAIIRTAGIDRTRAEIKRDYEYLVRLWEGIREQTLSSTAPALIYEEGDLIKRTIRDLYTSDIEEVLVEGEEGFNHAKDFMKTLLPASAAHVKLYKENVPLFYAYNIEDQLSSMYDPSVKLRSGGYIVINPTEALISIDVNSGRMTGERNIEETATRTNLEAVQEIARQLRLRDLAGLIVIDLIDMMDSRNRRSVERALKDALKLDRAKIQLGRISAFGLLEMSRQRLRPSLSETSSMPCPHCQGKGLIRSDASVAIQVIRAMEKEAAPGTLSEIRLTLPPSVALHLLNSRRDSISGIEKKYDINVLVQTDASLPQSLFRLEKVKNQNKRSSNNAPPVSVAEHAPLEEVAAEELQAEPNEVVTIGADAADSEILVPRDAVAPRDDDHNQHRRGRRGGRGRQGGRGGFGNNRPHHNRDAVQPQAAEGMPQEGAAQSEPGSNDNRPPRDERGPRRRRGGRWRNNRDRNSSGGGEGGQQPREYAQRQDSGSSHNSGQPQGGSRSSFPPVSHAPSVPPLSEQASSDAKPKKGWWRRIVES